MLEDATEEWERLRRELTEIMKERNLTKAALCRSAGINRQNYGSMERRGNPRLSTLARIAKALGGSLSIRFF